MNLYDDDPDNDEAEELIPIPEELTEEIKTFEECYINS